MPPTSPAATRFWKSSSKVSGKRLSASAKVEPDSTASLMVVSCCAERRVRCLLALDLQALHERQSGIDHRRELPREDDQIARGHLRPKELRHRDLDGGHPRGGLLDLFGCRHEQISGVRFQVQVAKLCGPDGTPRAYPPDSYGGMSGRGPEIRDLRPQSEAVARTTSSIVVMPIFSFVSASIRSERIPWRIASRLSSSVEAPLRTNSRSSSLKIMIS